MRSTFPLHHERGTIPNREGMCAINPDRQLVSPGPTRQISTVRLEPAIREVQDRDRPARSRHARDLRHRVLGLARQHDIREGFAATIRSNAASRKGRAVPVCTSGAQLLSRWRASCSMANDTSVPVTRAASVSACAMRPIPQPRSSTRASAIRVCSRSHATTSTVACASRSGRPREYAATAASGECSTARS